MPGSWPWIWASSVSSSRFAFRLVRLLRRFLPFDSASVRPAAAFFGSCVFGSPPPRLRCAACWPPFARRLLRPGDRRLLRPVQLPRTTSVRSGKNPWPTSEATSLVPSATPVPSCGAVPLPPAPRPFCSWRFPRRPSLRWLAAAPGFAPPAFREVSPWAHLGTVLPWGND